MSTRRQALANCRKQATTHAGLWLDKFIREQSREDIGSRRELIEQASSIPIPKSYARWFEQWQQSLLDYGAVCRVAETRGRMVLGLGQESVLETSVTVHHTYGVPYIPGSALKGLAASFTRQHLGDEWQMESDAYQILFGNTETAGYVTFFDAMPQPNSVHLHPDVLTVHHRDYYRDGSEPPADWDSPNPVPFPSATGKFLLALRGPEEWVETAFTTLEHALRIFGIGAKTSSGYGKLKVESVIVMDPDQEKIDQLIRRVEALRTNEVAGQIHTFYQQWKDLDVGDTQRRRVAEAIVAKVKEAKREKLSRKKAWYQEVLAGVE